MTFISEKPSSEVLLCPDEELGIIDIETFQDSQEWHLYQHVKVSFLLIIIEKMYSKTYILINASTRGGSWILRR